MTIEKGELATSVEEKKSKNENHLSGKGKLLHWSLLSLVCWLMLAGRLCVYNAGLKVDARREISTVVMTSYYENVCSCKRHTVVRRTFCFWRFTLLFLGLAIHYRESWWHMFPHQCIVRKVSSQSQQKMSPIFQISNPCWLKCIYGKVDVLY